MSADLPDCANYRSSFGMARVLASYIDDPQAIRSRILEDFDKAPAIVTIARMRRDYLAERDAPKPLETFKPHEGYYPSEQYDRMTEASNKFVRALELERARSVELARSLGALHSPLLDRPELVNRALEREVDKARRLNGGEL